MNLEIRIGYESFHGVFIRRRTIVNQSNHFIGSLKYFAIHKNMRFRNGLLIVLSLIAKMILTLPPCSGQII